MNWNVKLLLKLLHIIGLFLFLGVVVPANAENPFVEIEMAESAADVAKKRLSDLFRKIMRNPTSDELNLAYAQLAEESGFINKAIAAYQRILAGDPKNITAKNELDRLTRLLEAKRKEPMEQTRFTVALLSNYESNASHNQPSRKPENSEVESLDSSNFGAFFRVSDDRVYFGQRFKSNILAFGNINNRYASGDLALISANTGPVFDVKGDWTVRPGVSATHARMDHTPLFNGFKAIVDFENENPNSPTRSINFSLGYDDYDTDYNGRDALVADAAIVFAIKSLAMNNDLLQVRPYYKYNGASGKEHQTRYNLFEINSTYLYPFMKGVFAGPFFKISGRFYEGRDEITESQDRWNVLLIPGVKVLFIDLLPEYGAFVLNYSFERNFSNDGDKTYRNHRIGGFILWDF